MFDHAVEAITRPMENEATIMKKKNEATLVENEVTIMQNRAMMIETK